MLQGFLWVLQGFGGCRRVFVVVTWCLWVSKGVFAVVVGLFVGVEVFFVGVA